MLNSFKSIKFVQTLLWLKNNDLFILFETMRKKTQKQRENATNR